MPALIMQTKKLLNDPQVLLELRNLRLYDIDPKKKALTPSEWVNKFLGKSEANSKDGTVRYEDELFVAAALDAQHHVFVAFRPAGLKDASSLARLQSVRPTDTSANPNELLGDNFKTSVPPVLVLTGPGFEKLTKSIAASNVPAGEWPQNPNHTAADVVKQIAGKRKLSEHAAVLYAQLLALPEPTTNNICTWNGWSKADLKKASTELVDKKLVLQATRSRAGRDFFLPGEWLELKAPWLPIERWKLNHLTELAMDVGEPCPAGGPMVLRPYEDLFAIAWQRILDGDEPRYEDVKPVGKRAKKKE
jgi:hypothetical protein